MKYILLLISCLSFYLTQAQTQEVASPPRVSVSVQSTFNQVGGFGEVYLKPKISAWASLGFSKIDGRLGFGEDTTSTNFFNLPQQTILYDNLQQRITVRVGARFYETSRREKWSFWYSPVLGFSNLSEPSEDFNQAYQREDLHFSSEVTGRREAERTLELGGEIGARIMFLRKLYAEGSVLMLGERSLLEKNSSQEINGINARVAIGIIF